MALRIAQDILKGIRPLDRVPGLKDAVLSGAANLVGSDRFAPSFDLIVNGSPVIDDVRQHITSIEYEDNEELFDQLKITLQGYYEDPIKRRTVSICEWVQSDPTFSEGNIVWFLAGYGPYVRLIGGGEIVKREFSYSDNPQVTIVCYEPLHRMANVFAEQEIVYKGMRSSDIVKKIAQKPNYSGVIGSLFNTEFIQKLPIFTPKAEAQRRGESDYAFLKRMADVRGWHLFTRFDLQKKKFNLFYGPDVDTQESVFRYEFQPQIRLLPEDTILEFTPTINTIDQNTEVEITSIDEKQKKKKEQNRKYVPYADGKNPVNRKLSGNNTGSVEKELQNPVSYRFELFGVSKKIIASRPFKDEGEVKKFVINWARETIKNFITGTGKVSGNEQLQSRQNIYFMGLGETFSGTESKPATWYLQKVTHRVTAGSSLVFETTFDCRKAVDWLPEGDLVANPPAAEKTRQQKAKFTQVTGIRSSLTPVGR